MHKFIRLFVVFFLVPALLQEPVYASLGFARSPLAPPTEVFSQQALASQPVPSPLTEILLDDPAPALIRRIGGQLQYVNSAPATISSPVMLFASNGKGHHSHDEKQTEVHGPLQQLKDQYEQSLYSAFHLLRNLVQVGDKTRRAILSKDLIIALTNTERISASIVALLDQEGREALSMKTSQERYYRNAVSESFKDSLRNLIRKNRGWLRQSFNEFVKEDILEDIPVMHMGLVLYTQYLLSLVEAVYEDPRADPRSFQVVLQMFKDHERLFNGALAVHVDQFLFGRPRMVNLLANGFSDDALASLNVHEDTHQLLRFINPKFLSIEVVSGTNPADWFTTALEMLSFYRYGDVETSLQERENSLMGNENERAFIDHLQKPVPATTRERLKQIDETVRHHLARDPGDIASHYYRPGAVLGAVALQAGRAAALREGRARDEDFVYLMAGKYVVEAARGGPEQTFAECIINADKALGQFKGPGTGHPPSLSVLMVPMVHTREEDLIPHLGELEETARKYPGTFGLFVDHGGPPWLPKNRLPEELQNVSADQIIEHAQQMEMEGDPSLMLMIEQYFYYHSAAMEIDSARARHGAEGIELAAGKTWHGALLRWSALTGIPLIMEKPIFEVWLKYQWASAKMMGTAGQWFHRGLKNRENIGIYINQMQGAVESFREHMAERNARITPQAAMLAPQYDAIGILLGVSHRGIESALADAGLEVAFANTGLDQSPETPIMGIQDLAGRLAAGHSVEEEKHIQVLLTEVVGGLLTKFAEAQGHLSSASIYRTVYSMVERWTLPDILALFNKHGASGINPLLSQWIRQKGTPAEIQFFQLDQAA